MRAQAPLSAIILAAGFGSRFGKPKWQASFQGKSFLSMIIEKLKAIHVSDIVCVVPEGAVILEDVKVAENPEPEKGMLSSLACGTRQLDHKSVGSFIFPVDHPLVQLQTLQKLQQAFQTYLQHIIRPVCNDKRGHPIILPMKVLQELPGHDVDGGLKQALRGKVAAFWDVIVEDEGVLKNINYPEDIK